MALVSSPHPSCVPAGVAHRLAADRRGAAAVEFALVAMPFVLLLMGVPQMGVYFMTQSSLDSGVIQAGDALINSYYANATPATMTPGSLKTLIVAKAGGMVRNDSTLSVDLRKLSALGSGASPIADTVDTTVPYDIVALRAQVAVTTFVPFLGTLYARSSVIVRRQAL